MREKRTRKIRKQKEKGEERKKERKKERKYNLARMSLLVYSSDIVLGGLETTITMRCLFFLFQTFVTEVHII